MESKWQKIRREYVEQLRMDDELPNTSEKPQIDIIKEKSSKREVKTDAE